MKIFNLNALILITLFLLFNLVGFTQVTPITNFEDDNVFSRSNTSTAVVVDNEYFFVARINGREQIWKTNGFPEGTVPLLDFDDINDSFSISDLISFNGTIAFYLSRNNSDQLFIYDKSQQKAVQLSGANSGRIFTAFNRPFNYNGRLYYSYFENEFGEEIWSTDGSANTSEILTNIRPGSSGSSSFQAPFIYNGLMYFAAEQNAFEGAGLWSTDGTAANTKLIKLLNDQGSSNIVRYAGTSNGISFIIAQVAGGDVIYTTDGTADGTKNISIIREGIREQYVVGNKMFFTVQNGDNKKDLWVCDGTTSGTKVLTDLDNDSGRNPFQLTEYNGDLYFFGFHDGELYLTKVDPLSEDVSFIYPFSSSNTNVSRTITNVGDELLIVGFDKFRENFELFTSNGTMEGTELLVDLNEEFSASSYPTDIKKLERGDVIFKAEQTEENRELFYYKKSNFEPFNLNLTINEIKCNGGTSRVFASGKGGTPPYSYEWSSPLGMGGLLTAPAGDYVVTVTDADGSEIVDSFSLTEPEAIVVSDVTIINEDGMNANGSVAISVMGGTPPYTYEWSNGAMTNEITGLSTGDYEVTITDDNDCVLVDTFTVAMVSSVYNASSTIQVRPTVANERLIISSIESLENASYQIVNKQGQVLKQSHIVDRYINLSDITSGMYLIRFYQDNKVLGEARFIKIE